VRAIIDDGSIEEMMVLDELVSMAELDGRNIIQVQDVQRIPTWYGTALTVRIYVTTLTAGD
jgi:hypothetical protein